MIIGRSSLMVMWIPAQHSGDWNWNHSPCEEYALHPQLLEALETTIHAGLALIETDIMLTPFCLERKSPTIEGPNKMTGSCEGDGGVLLQMLSGWLYQPPSHSIPSNHRSSGLTGTIWYVFSRSSLVNIVPLSNFVIMAAASSGDEYKSEQSSNLMPLLTLCLAGCDKSTISLHWQHVALGWMPGILG